MAHWVCVWFDGVLTKNNDGVCNGTQADDGEISVGALIGRSAVAAFFMVCVVAVPAAAEPLPPPEGPVALTITGKISNENRGARNDFADAFFNTSDVDFDKAASFDLAMLEALGTTTLKTQRDDWPEEISFEGPSLRDVLGAAGALGKQVTVEALDGYAADLTLSEIADHDILFAIKGNGRFFGIGDRGPGWIIFPQEMTADYEDESGSRWVWGVYHIAVHD
jgi:hypothetical protein